MTLYGAIDIGSNSTRLLIAKLGEGRIVPVETDLCNSRLAEGLEDTGALGKDAQARTLAAVAEFWERCREVGVEGIRVGATSAVRGAANGKEFLQSLKKATGLEAEVFSGEMEARLSFYGVTWALPMVAAGPSLIIDIGGGSTELLRGVGREVRASVSLPLGAVGLMESHPFLRNGPLGPTQLEQMEERVRAVLAGSGLEDLGGGKGEAPPLAVGVGGTVTTLTAIYLRLERYGANLVHGVVLPRRHLRRILLRLAAMDPAQRKEVRGLPADRADTIIAGTIILLALLAKLDLPELISSEGDILLGMLVDLGAKMGWGPGIS